MTGTNRQPTDIFISGAGIAGLVAAATLARAGLTVTIADPAPPDGADLRSTAYLVPSRRLLERAGVWAALAPHATPLRALRVIDTRDRPPRPVETRLFEPSDAEGDGDGHGGGNGHGEAFGWNVPNRVARAALIARLTDAPNVDLRMGTAFRGILTRESAALVDLADGTRLRARLAVAADGRASPLRSALGIGTRIRRYGQKAMAFEATHERPHGDVSTEIYARGGAFTLVPLPDRDGLPCSAVVWMNDGAEAARLMGLDDAALGAAATARSTGIVGAIRPAGRRAIWPVVTQTATALTAERCILIAEAAHVLPPIGAQGLNTSLADVAALSEAAERHADGLGGAAMCDAYARARHRDLSARAAVIDLFNRICRSDSEPISALRLAGLRTIHGVTPVRRAVVRAGLGPAR